MTDSQKAFENMVKMMPDNGYNDELIENSKVFWEFQEFIMKKFSISEKESEAKFKAHITGKMVGASEEDLTNPELYIDHLGDFATECGFADADKLKSGFRFMSKIGQLNIE